MTIFIGFIQLMMLGEGSTMNPRKFAIYGIADRNLQFGLLLSGLSGIPSLCLLYTSFLGERQMTPENGLIVEISGDGTGLVNGQ